MIFDVDHGPTHLSKVRTGDEIVVSVQSWFPDNEEPESPITLSGIVTNLAVNLASQGIGILDEGLITLTTDPTWQTSILSFLQNQPESFDYTHAQGYLVYVYFDASLTIDENYSGMLQVTSPNEIEELQTQLLTMPGEGFFYTYLTNFSDNLVTFDNLTIRHRQGTLRNIHEYYPYGLEYWRSGSKLYDRGDQYSEFHHREWEMDGIEMNRFAARWYDPAIARWHAPDPLEQMHSPYVALCGDPANFVDPDGRAGIHLSDWDKQNILGFAGVLAGGAAMAGIGQALNGLSAVSQAFQAIRGPLSFKSSISSGVSLIKGVSSMVTALGVANKTGDFMQSSIKPYIQSTQINSLGKAPINASNDHYEDEKFPKIQPNDAGAPVRNKGAFPGYQIYQISAETAKNAFSAKSVRQGYFRQSGGDWDKVFYDPNFDDASKCLRGAYFAMKPNKVEDGWSTIWSIAANFDQNGLIDASTKSQIDSFLSSVAGFLAARNDLSLYSPLQLVIYGTDNYDSKMFNSPSARIEFEKKANFLVNQVKDYLCTRVCGQYHIVLADGISYMTTNGGTAISVPLMDGDFGLKLKFKRNIYGF